MRRRRMCPHIEDYKDLGNDPVIRCSVGKRNAVEALLARWAVGEHCRITDLMPTDFLCLAFLTFFNSVSCMTYEA